MPGLSLGPAGTVLAASPASPAAGNAPATFDVLLQGYVLDTAGGAAAALAEWSSAHGLLPQAMPVAGEGAWAGLIDGLTAHARGAQEGNLGPGGESGGLPVVGLAILPFQMQPAVATPVVQQAAVPGLRGDTARDVGAVGLAAGRQLLPAWMGGAVDTEAVSPPPTALHGVAVAAPKDAAAVPPVGQELAQIGQSIPRPDMPAERGGVMGKESFPVHLPVQAADWDRAFGQRVLFMASRQIQYAELSLNPPNLGSIEVRLSLHGGDAGAQFFAPQAGVREAIEAALPRLREMLAEVGLRLGDAQVSAESFFSSPRHDGPGSQAWAADEGQAIEDVPPRRAALGLVDLYV